MAKEYILYLGNYLDEKIVAERKLPTNNIAGTNRMHRLSLALSTHYNVIILSPGVSMRLRKSKNIFLSHKFKRIDNLKVLYASAISVPYFVVVFSFFSYLFSYFKLLKKTKAKNIVIYNFNPTLLYLVCLTKIFFPKIQIINNIEDISIPKLSDFSSKSEDRGLQQYIYFICMKMIGYLVQAYIIPTKKFISFLPQKDSILVVTGCIAVKEFNPEKPKEKLEILFSGKIAFEHGIDVFIEALKLLENSKNDYSKININISGGGNKVAWLTQQVAQFKKLNVKYHGFVSNTEYNSLLENSDICVALQKDMGRHAKFKTPSKVYEYLGNSKIVIATDVGDLSEINNEIIKICKPLNENNLKNIIVNILSNKDSLFRLKKNIYKFSKSEYDLQTVGNRLYYFIK